MRALTAVSFILVALLFFTNIRESYEAKILAVYPVQARSHMTVVLSVVKELANRGHDVTVVSAFPEEKPLPNYRDIVLKKYTMEEMFDTKETKFEPFEFRDMNYFQKMFLMWTFGSVMCNKVLAEEPVQNLIKSNEEFDLIFLESFFINCFIGFAHKFKAPVVQVATFAGTEQIGDLVGNPYPYAYVPDTFQDYDHHMDFKERLANTLGLIISKLAHRYFIRQQDTMMRKYFQDPNMPYIEELEKSTALILANHHFSINHPRPLVPNFVEVGGMHVKPPKKLPADLQKYIDEAKDGVIYFSMGSNLKSAEMPNKTIEAITNAFSKLKQKVIWKWEEDTLPGKPENVKLGKWLPQSDILAHPNVKLFITHGGLLSTQETINRGVPVVGIPILGDQHMNMHKTEALGVGKTLDFKTISEESILSTVKEVLENPKYRESVQRISRIYRDQPLTPLEQAVFWSEYVIRHKGAPHMRSAALDLAWYQYFLLDVIAVLAIVLFTVLLILYFIVRGIFRMCCGSSKRKTQISDKKKRS